MSKEFKVVRTKFKVGKDVTEEQIESKLGSLNGYEKLSQSIDTMIEGTIDGETFIKVKPTPEPEPDSEEKEKSSS